MQMVSCGRMQEADKRQDAGPGARRWSTYQLWSYLVPTHWHPSVDAMQAHVWHTPHEHTHVPTPELPGTHCGGALPCTGGRQSTHLEVFATAQQARHEGACLAAALEQGCGRGHGCAHDGGVIREGVPLDLRVLGVMRGTSPTAVMRVWDSMNGMRRGMGKKGG